MMLFRHAKICLTQLSLRSRGTYPECRVEVATALCAATEHGCELLKCAFFMMLFWFTVKKKSVWLDFLKFMDFDVFFSCPSPCVFGHLWSWPHLFWSKWLSAQKEWAVGLKHAMISPKHPSTCIKISETYTENMMHSLPKDSDSSHWFHPWSGRQVTCDTRNSVTCSSHKCDAKIPSLVAVQPLKNKKKWWVGGTSWCLGTSTPLGFLGGWDKGLGGLGLGGPRDHEHRVEHHDVWLQAHL